VEAERGPVPERDGPRPARRHSLRDQVLDALRRALLRGDLAPGTVHSAPVLAARYGTSATPVREAMQQLAREGAVEVVPNRGYRVADRTPRELTELAEVRALLEVPVLLRLAAEADPAGWEELRPLARAAEERAAAGDRAGHACADRAFRAALLARSGNAQLASLAAELHLRAQQPPGSAAAPPQHGGGPGALLDALAARDLPAVEALARAQLGAPA
jgi:DNA-binding GntR family transcriptional regulator